jgi:hypothetical protein
MIKYQFTKKIIFSKNIYRIEVEAPCEMLYDLSSGFLQEPEGVKEVLTEIQRVRNDQVEIYSFGGSDYCIIDVLKDKSIVMYDFGENVLEIETNDLVKLLEDWLAFLIANS